MLPPEDAVYSPQERPVVDHFYWRLNELQQQRSKQVRRVPVVGHRPLDLYALFRAVQNRGGSKAIQHWKDIGRELNLAASVTNAGFTLRTKFESYIAPFEDILMDEFPITDFEDQRVHLEMTGPGPVESLRDQTYLATFTDHQEGIHHNANWLVPAQSPVMLGTSLRLPHGEADGIHPTGVTANSIYGTQASQAVHAQYEARLAPNAGLKVFQITNRRFTDATLMNLIRALQLTQVEELCLGSLAKITVLPEFSALPRTLNKLTLIDVPDDIADSFLTALSSLGIRELSVFVASESSPLEATSIALTKGASTPPVYQNTTMIVKRRPSPDITTAPPSDDRRSHSNDEPKTPMKTEELDNPKEHQDIFFSCNDDIDSLFAASPYWP
ncbi:ARID1 protein [Giardia muris]|uniref:ARID1 protein n=1 Tax=Giardia muris TaxID=5742 RepID=A0A4Z1SSI4_GIAMU|nr:ARID1 protein [Giardia muris]|eukprot:TNJ26618.1 ARID1 protein [Giardia muris]